MFYSGGRSYFKRPHDNSFCESGVSPNPKIRFQEHSNPGNGNFSPVNNFGRGGYNQGRGFRGNHSSFRGGYNQRSYYSGGYTGRGNHVY